MCVAAASGNLTLGMRKVTLRRLQSDAAASTSTVTTPDLHPSMRSAARSQQGSPLPSRRPASSKPRAALPHTPQPPPAARMLPPPPDVSDRLTKADLRGVKMCEFFKQGKCQKPDCNFAHSVEEMREARWVGAPLDGGASVGGQQPALCCAR